ncbi:hypothetical protein DPMN_021509 [Dreissena polymorpha]|uniref:Uncharacterized protein n=1 Tax=Dreissena polymorpha TaxID=45954 RepID=A0A9D4NM58_DREPO|nr:hypothetical protein DPMN_021509 [Dreissena polymorpha]
MCPSTSLCVPALRLHYVSQHFIMCPSTEAALCVPALRLHYVSQHFIMCPSTEAALCVPALHYVSQH